MTRETESLEQQARKLDPEERADLALKLIESLDSGEDENAEELWLDEAERRLADYDAGKIEAIPVDGALEEIEQQVK